MKCINEKSLYDKFMNGGLGYGSICMPNYITDLLLIIIFPPIWVILHQYKNYKKTLNFKSINIRQIMISFILTSLFYFPGFIHALHIMNNKQFCTAVF